MSAGCTPYPCHKRWDDWPMIGLVKTLQNLIFSISSPKLSWIYSKERAEKWSEFDFRCSPLFSNVIPVANCSISGTNPRLPLGRSDLRLFSTERKLLSFLEERIPNLFQRDSKQAKTLFEILEIQTTACALRQTDLVWPCVPRRAQEIWATIPPAAQVQSFFFSFFRWLIVIDSDW